MNKCFYPKLALSNIKNNAKAYIPYILTCIGTIVMFYNMYFLSVAKDLGSVSDSGSLRQILAMGADIISIFSVIFLFYTNSFLIKRRKKEFGLFNILGMEKKHIARVMFFETLYIALFSLTIGILTGVLLSKLMILLLFKLIRFTAPLGFEIPLAALLQTVALFSGIFAINLIRNIFQVYRSKPVELLKGGDVGEKEPKTKVLLTGIGVICLGIGYYIALATETPLAAINLFFLAVLLVMIGTYCLFTAGSIAVLKGLRKNKKYYYQPSPFISISGMIYRMKQNAVGLANICILSTAVIITISTTISLYVGMEDLLNNRYERQIMVSGDNVTEEQAHKLDEAIESLTAEFGGPKNALRLRYFDLVTTQKGADFIYDPESFSPENTAMLFLITLEDYREIAPVSESLAEGEALLYIEQGKIPQDKVNLNGLEFSIKARLSDFQPDGSIANIMTNTYYLIVDDLDTVKKVYQATVGKDDFGERSYYYAFDVESMPEKQIEISTNIKNVIYSTGISGYVEGRELSRDSFLSVYGGLFLLGLFIGLLFILATVLIIYYKQIAEGYDDKKRFEIMQKVGMSRDDVKRSIRNQVLTVFFLPLVATVIHIVVAFKVVTKLLQIFYLTNIPLFTLCTAVTILVFAALYALVYALTARTYYKIVSYLQGI